MSAEFNPIGSGRQTGSSTDLRPLERVRALMADSFQFTAPDSPGLHFCGGLADPQLAGLSAALPRISVAGSDLSEDGAETRRLGEAAERLSSLYDLSRDLNENDTWTLVSSGQGLAFAGRHKQAYGLSDEALMLNQHLSPVEWGYQVGTRFLCEDYDMAFQAAEKAGDVIPNLPAWKAASLVYMDRQPEALAEGQRFLEMMRQSWSGEANPSDADIVSWLLSSFPIRNGEDRQRFSHGVLSATGGSETALTLAN